MDPFQIIVGIVMIIVGLYAFYFPLQVRNYVSVRQWKTNPRRAEQKQKLYARLLGLFFFGIGSLVIVAEAIL